MKYQIGQKVWVRRDKNEIPYPATITGFVGVSSTGDNVYEFEHPNVFGGITWSGAAEYDIYATEEEAYADNK